MHLSSPPTKFLPYIFMAHCSRALSPSLRLSPTRVWAAAVRSQSFSDLQYQVPSLSASTPPPIASTFGATRPSAAAPLPPPRPRLSSQVDKVSLVEDGSSWEPSEGK